MNTPRVQASLRHLLAIALLALLAQGRAQGQGDAYGHDAYDPANEASTSQPVTQDTNRDTDQDVYVSELAGSAALSPASGGSQPVELNEPLQTGDRMVVNRMSRAEIVLPGGAIARLDAGSEVEIAERSGSSSGVLRLGGGSMQVVVGGASTRLPVRVDTSNATAYLDPDGSYLVETDANSAWTRVVVRDGGCDLLTPAGSRRLEAGDEAQIDGDQRVRIAIGDAGRVSSIEDWGARLEDRARQADVRYVDPELRYAAAPLSAAGNWLSVDGEWAWQPRVEVSWRPYWNGRWAYTSSGLTWVAHEPWGWVTSHYGSWDYRDGRGWLWYPGNRYSPAWVYWYWGPSHVGWCPAGYYSRRSGGWRDGYRAGIYGWAGGWNGFLDWNFVSLQYLDSPGLSRYCRRGSDLRGDLRYGALPRGIITTDTRGARPGRWQRPEDLLRDFRGRGDWTRRDSDLPDVSSFIGRRHDRGTPRPGGDNRGQPAIFEGRPVLKLDTPSSVRPPQGHGPAPDRLPGVSGNTDAGRDRRSWRDDGVGESDASRDAGGRPGNGWRSDPSPRLARPEPLPGSDPAGERAPRVRTLPAPSSSWRSALDPYPRGGSPGSRWNSQGTDPGGSRGDRTPIRRILDGVRQAPQVSSPPSSGGHDGSDARPARNDRPERDRNDRGSRGDRGHGPASSSRPAGGSSDSGGAPPPGA